MGKVKRNRDNPNEMNELIYREDKTKSLLVGKLIPYDCKHNVRDFNVLNVLQDYYF